MRISELRYRRLFETAQDGILILDANSGEIMDVNPFLIDLLDYPFEELRGRKLWEIGQFKDIAAIVRHSRHFNRMNTSVTKTFRCGEEMGERSRSNL